MATRKKIPLITADATLNIAAGLTLDISGADVDIVGSGVAVITFPSATSTLATIAGSETLTNKTLTSPVIGSITNTGTLTLPTTTGTVALTSDITGTNSGTNTGDNATNTQYSGLVTNATHTGDATGSGALTVVKINGTLMSGLATGILKNTTTTGVPSIALNSDLPTMTATVGGAVPTPPNNTTSFLRGDGTFAAPSGSGDMVLADVQSVTGKKTYDTTKLAMKGSSTGVNTVASANASATSYTNTIPAKTGTFAMTADITGTNSNTNTGDQTSIVGITGTKAEFDTAVTDGNILYDGDVTVPVKATGAELDTGTDDAKFATAKAIADSKISYIDGVETLTNKRITSRVGTTASSGTPTINTDTYDSYSITELAVAITSMTTNLTGTPTNFQKLIIRFKDNGTARAITWGASFEAKGVDLPIITVLSKVLTVGFIYDTVTSKWGCVASAQEA